MNCVTRKHIVIIFCILITYVRVSWKPCDAEEFKEAEEVKKKNEIKEITTLRAYRVFCACYKRVFFLYFSKKARRGG